MDKNIKEEILNSVKYIELCAFHQGSFYNDPEVTASYDKLQLYIREEYAKIKELLKGVKNG